MSISVVIAGGGTGGHVFPGIALAEAIQKSSPNAAVCFVGTQRGLETRAIPAAGYPLETIGVLPWARTLGVRRLLAPASAVRAAWQARGILRRRRASVVAAMGGYASLPVALAARSMGVPLIVHEQNAVPGRANRISAFFATRLAVTFASSASEFFDRARVTATVTGNPVRAAIATMDRAALREHAVASLGLDAARKTVLVTGGSRGARRLNEVAQGLSDRWAARGDFQILLIAGASGGVGPAANLRVVEFLERMELAYAAADLVIARAGAGLAELACASLPMILVPYPFARDDHQTANAMAAVKAGAAVQVRDSKATPERVGNEVELILHDPHRYAAMSAAARAFARPGAAEDVAKMVVEAAGER